MRFEGKTIVGRAEQIIQQVTTWPQMTSQSHRFSGIEFNIGKVEIGHIHGDTLLDIPFTRKLRDLLVRDEETQEHHLLPESGWTSFYLRRDEDVAQALRLLRLSYIQKRLRRSSAEERDLLTRDLAALEFSVAIQALLGVTGDPDPNDSEDTEADDDRSP